MKENPTNEVVCFFFFLKTFLPGRQVYKHKDYQAKSMNRILGGSALPPRAWCFAFLAFTIYDVQEGGVTVNVHKLEGNEFQFKELSNINRLNISGSTNAVKPGLQDVTQTISRRKLPELHNLQRTVLVFLPAFGIPALLHSPTMQKPQNANHRLDF